MHAKEIIEKYYKENPKLKEILIEHSEKVKNKALEIAKNIPELNPNLKFIEEASLLHDIGIIKVASPNIGASGEDPYIKHGILGREILEKEGLNKHALVCERHVGIGLSKEEIIAQNLPLPHRNMLPESIEEKVITMADKFFSKNPNKSDLTLKDIEIEVSKYGEGPLKRFKELKKLLKLENE